MKYFTADWHLFETRPHLMRGEGNPWVVIGNIYENKDWMEKDVEPV